MLAWRLAWRLAWLARYGSAGRVQRGRCWGGVRQAGRGRAQRLGRPGPRPAVRLPRHPPRAKLGHCCCLALGRSTRAG
ncbi:hypothetical protein V8C86DRAFT_2553793 [Haematococcus lacustris]